MVDAQYQFIQLVSFAKSEYLIQRLHDFRVEFKGFPQLEHIVIVDIFLCIADPVTGKIGREGEYKMGIGKEWVFGFVVVVETHAVRLKRAPRFVDIFRAEDFTDVTCVGLFA